MAAALLSPTLDASTLAMYKSGSTADPACRWPAPAMYPTHAMRSYRERMIGVIYQDWEHRPEEDSNERDSHGVPHE